MKNTISIILTSCLLFFVSNLIAQTNDLPQGDYAKKVYKSGNNSLNYQIMYPNNFDQTKKYPLIVFLHGMGERGTDNEKQMTHGSRLFRDSIDKYPAIVIFPQCPPTDYWANLYRPNEGGKHRQFTFHTDEPANPTLTMVMELINKTMGEKYVDNSRLYVSGLSMGGMGTFELVWRMNDKIAAALPICGGANPKMAEKMVDVPMWIFHGVKDDVVHPHYSIVMTEAIQQAGGKAKITLYPEANHNSWDAAFAEPEYLSWMFSKNR